MNGEGKKKKQLKKIDLRKQMEERSDDTIIFRSIQQTCISQKNHSHIRLAKEHGLVNIKKSTQSEEIEPLNDK